MIQRKIKQLCYWWCQLSRAFLQDSWWNCIRTIRFVYINGTKNFINISHWTCWIINHALSERCKNLIIHLSRSFAKYTKKEFIKYISFPFGRKGRLTIVFNTTGNTKLPVCDLTKDQNFFGLEGKDAVKLATHFQFALFKLSFTLLLKDSYWAQLAGSLEDFAFLHKRHFFKTRIRNSELNHGTFLLYIRDFVGILRSTASINTAFHASQISFISSTKKAVVQGIFEKSSRRPFQSAEPKP